MHGTSGPVTGGLTGLATPGSAMAVTASPPGVLGLALSALGLVIAVLLLVEALRVRRLAVDGAIGSRISFVVLATLCLATSALIEWLRLLLPAAIGADEASFASRALVIAAMGLLAAYFYSVRSAMQRYLDSLTGAELLDVEDDPEHAGSPAPDGEPAGAEAAAQPSAPAASKLDAVGPRAIAGAPRA